eukprot:gb/GFBE01045052.1/.p1 GENE.gb/GFBE01045052.1/~~gb/GFBE01045052.1/.p1  ORF type:complete len:123 (+),score=44.76 gb/GFBE01045052.1/:1-369(+)
MRRAPQFEAVAICTMMSMLRLFAVTALVLCFSGSDASSDFLATKEAAETAQAVTDKVADVHASEEKTASAGIVLSAEVVKEAPKEIELDAGNPYPQTGATAEALALLFMIVACMICYLECCK